jgi:predicted GNAT superfamily acetyltransferase
VPVQLRALTPDDAPAVLRLNERSVHHLAPLDAAGYAWFLAHAVHPWAAEVDGALAGFTFVLDPGLDYPSENYRWFSQRWERFRYLDRVVVDEGRRRRGVATAIYDAVEAAARAEGVPVLLEVNAVPPNEPSLAFHAARGYAEVGTLRHGDAKVVSLRAWTPAGASEVDHDQQRPSPPSRPSRGGDRLQGPADA